MTAYRTQLRDALAQIVVQKGLVPSTTHTADSALGATSITVADALAFPDGGVVTYWDGTGETFIIDHSVGNVIYPSFEGWYTAGVAAPGLRHAHLTGALLSTNMAFVPPEPHDTTLASTHFGNGYPFIRIWVASGVSGWLDTARETQMRAMASFLYQLPINQPYATDLQSDLWLKQQMERADADIATFIAELEDNFSLIVNGTDNAEQVEQFLQSATRNPLPAKSPVYEDYLDILVYGPRTVHD